MEYAVRTTAWPIGEASTGRAKRGMIRVHSFKQATVIADALGYCDGACQAEIVMNVGGYWIPTIEARAILEELTEALANLEDSK